MKKTMMWPIALIAIVGCSKSLSGKKVETELASQFEKAGAIEKISCPSSIKAKTGTAFTCSLQFKGGDKFTVDGKITSVDGSTAHWETSLTEKMFDAATASKTLHSALAAQLGYDPVIDCGAPRHLHADGSAICSLTSREGKHGTITVGDKGYDVAWQN